MKATNLKLRKPRKKVKEVLGELASRRDSARKLKPSTKEEYQTKVAYKAYELYEKRGRANGADWQDWFEAEKIVAS